MPEHVTSLDIVWVLVCTALVFLMQAGFTCLESGFVRSKNSINVAIKNIVDFLLAAALFWLVGFAIMFGESAAGWVGTTGFLFNDIHQPWLLAFFLFQLAFCGTATTIVSGAVAERMRFAGYLAVAALISGLLYPLMGHWAWGGAESGTATGWLGQLGFVDFAGSTVVHSLAGWVALAAVLIIGPRLGRFDNGGTVIPGHNLPMAALGTLLLWFGWFGFNGGSTLAVTDETPLILVNTTLAAAFGGLAALGLVWRMTGRPDVGITMNGTLAGLVGITASANIQTPEAAVVIGAIAGAISVGATRAPATVQD